MDSKRNFKTKLGTERKLVKPCGKQVWGQRNLGLLTSVNRITTLINKEPSGHDHGDNLVITLYKGSQTLRICQQNLINFNPINLHFVVMQRWPAIFSSLSMKTHICQVLLGVNTITMTVCIWSKINKFFLST